MLARSDANRASLKNTLKFMGAAWVGAAAHMVYRAHEGTQNREASLGSAAGQAAVGALCLWRGFADD